MRRKNKTILELIGGVIFAASTIYAINRIIFSLATRHENLFESSGQFYKHNQGRIFYTKQGKGTPLLLIHDLDSASSSYEWHETIKTLSKNHTVYAIDLLGCGRSDKPRITYTSYLYVQLIHDFVKEVIADTPNVIATGNSASFVTMTEKMYPDTFHQLLFVNPVSIKEALALPKNNLNLQKELYECPILGTFLYCLHTSHSSILKRFKSEYFAQKSVLKYARKYHEAAHLKGSNCKFLYASQSGNFLGCNLTSCNTINKPIHLISGDKLNDVYDTNDEWLTLFPEADISLIANTKYLPQLEQAETFADICETILAD